MAYSTVTEALAAYNNNLDWDESPAKARICLQAIRYLLVNRAEVQKVAGAELSFASLEHERDMLEEFVQANPQTTVRSAWTRARVNR